MAKYTALIEQAADGSWGGQFPELSTIIFNGLTLEEAKKNAEEALGFWMASAKEEGLEIPAPTLHAVQIAAGSKGPHIYRENAQA